MYVCVRLVRMGQREGEEEHELKSDKYVVVKYLFSLQHVLCIFHLTLTLWYAKWKNPFFHLLLYLVDLTLTPFLSVSVCARV